MLPNGMTQEQLNSLNYIDLALKTRLTDKQRYAIDKKEVEQMNRSAEALRIKLSKRRKEQFMNYDRTMIDMDKLTAEIIDKNIAFGFEYN